MDKPVTFTFHDLQIKTTRDGGYRLTLDLPESETQAVSALLALNRTEQNFGASVMPITPEEDESES